MARGRKPKGRKKATGLRAITLLAVPTTKMAFLADSMTEDN